MASLILELSLGLWQDIHILEVYRKIEMEKNFSKMRSRFQKPSTGKSGWKEASHPWKEGERE